MVKGMDKARTMNKDAMWDLVHAERLALIDDLFPLAPEDWERPSTAAGWSVHDVAAHLLDNAYASTPVLLWAMLRAGFDFDRQNANGVARHKGATSTITLDGLKAAAARRDTPPVHLASRLVEEIAHGEDIRRALGLKRDYPPRALELAIEYQSRTPDSVGGGKNLAQRVRLVSDDEQFVLGLGPDLVGPRLELLMVLTGRQSAPGSLSGAGSYYLP